MMRTLLLSIYLAAYGLGWTIPERNHGVDQVINVVYDTQATSTLAGLHEVNDIFDDLEHPVEDRLNDLLTTVKGSYATLPRTPLAKDLDLAFFDGDAFLASRLDLQDDHDHDHDRDGKHGINGHRDHGDDHDHTDPRRRHHGSGHWGGGAPDENDPYDGTDPGDGNPFHRSPKSLPHHTPSSGRYPFPHPQRPPMPPSDPHSPHSDSSIMDLLHECPQTSRFHDLIQKDREIYDFLNDRKSNVTVFAPTNKAFELLDKHGKDHDIPPELLKRVLLYHIADGTHGSHDLRYHNTLATKLSEEALAGGHRQRVRIGLSHAGPTLNFYAVFKLFDSFADNGVIHHIDSILLPPPSVLTILQYLPTEFSTTETALHRTGLLDGLEKTPHDHSSLTDDNSEQTPFTLFAPSNRDWQKLGFAANAFLFSEWGRPYLKAIMKYHIVPGTVLYSDAVVEGRHHDKNHHGPVSGHDDRGDPSGNRGENSRILEDVTPFGHGGSELKKRNEMDDHHGLWHGYSHINLPTMLKDRSISIDITRFERFLSFRANGLSSVVISDAPARNGVLQIPDHVLIPPHSLDEHHHPPEMEEGEPEAWSRGEMPVSLLKAVLEPLVEAT